MTSGPAELTREGDPTLLDALRRAGVTDRSLPCRAGTCARCLCVADGVPYTRACVTRTRPGVQVVPQPRDAQPAAPEPGDDQSLADRHVHADVVVIGEGRSGAAAAEDARAAGRRVVTIESRRGEEAFGIYDGPLVVARTTTGLLQVHADEIVVATGTAHGLARQGTGLNVRVVGSAAREPVSPRPPADGVVCACTGTTLADLESVWERGFQTIELVKRATLVGTGTCQGAECLPALRAFIAARGGDLPPPFTTRPVARQPTIAEAAAGFHFPPTRRTALDGVHRAAGARMERFGGWWRPWRYPDPAEEYRAVRERVSIGDVGTLGKFLVSGPDAVAFCERLYPCRVADLGVDRARYALLLDERGYVHDDGLICRDAERRFFLTFTTGGAAAAEAWLRDWADAFGHDVRILDRTAAVGAINVTGPAAGPLLQRLGLDDPPAFMAQVRASVAGVPCRVLRLGFTGEPSFELHHAASRSVELWNALAAAGVGDGIAPHGLDTLLTLRLEKGHVIVGMDTDFDSTPRRLGMGWAARMDKGDFVGRHALTRVDRRPLDRQLVGLEIDGPPPDEGDVVRHGDAIVGQLTSSRWSPTLGRTVALAFVKLVDGTPPAPLRCDGREARVVTVPFYDPEGVRVRA